MALQMFFLQSSPPVEYHLNSSYPEMSYTSLDIILSPLFAASRKKIFTWQPKPWWCHKGMRYRTFSEQFLSRLETIKSKPTAVKVGQVRKKNIQGSKFFFFSVGSLRCRRQITVGKLLLKSILHNIGCFKVPVLTDVNEYIRDKRALEPSPLLTSLKHTEELADIKYLQLRSMSM